MSVLSEELRQKILAYLPRYPSKQAVTLPALHMVHDELRCVPREAIREIADMLDLSPAEVHDTMTFYGSSARRTPRWARRGCGCAAVWRAALRGGDELLRALCAKSWTCNPGGTSTDGKITLEFAECLGACEAVRRCMIDDEARMNVTPDKVDATTRRVAKIR